MARPNTLVDAVARVSQPDEAFGARAAAPVARQATVSFEGGRVGVLDLTVPRSAVWAEVLSSLRDSGQYAYVELDPATNQLTELLVPLAVRVGDITKAAEGVEVELIISHALHHLRRSNSDYDKLLEALEEARSSKRVVLVTERMDDHEIIDVRPHPNPSFAAAPAVPEAPPRFTPGAPVTLARAQELFGLVAGKTCCPASAPAPCIPFQYPDDGCWGRAHEMCRLMIASGAQPEKIWIYGGLRVASSNKPDCVVRWGWHVAPTLQVTVGASTDTYVVDPSLFSGPVTQPAWKNVQGDPSAVLEPSDAAVFYRTKGGGSIQYDPTYTQTNNVLTTYRNTLKLRSASASGPPPYANCMTRPTGVQWFGAIAGNATQRWFTFGWPAAWHVIWTIMPLTHCPGGPQLTWSVQVERASATQCTYWIAVRNLTADPVKFEGRYDVLSR